MAFQCPNCNVSLPDKSWLKVLFEDEHGSPDGRLVSFAEDWHLSKVGEIPVERTTRGEWMHCSECNHALVRFTQIRRQPEQGLLPGQWPELSRETWLAVPRRATRPVHPEVEKAVPDQAQYYREAACIVGDSPRASTVLTRRVLADLLKKYAGRDEFGLAERIDRFREDASHPAALRDNLHYLRAMGDFAAHSQEDDQANIVDIDLEDATWTLDLINRLFDYFIVTPARDAEIKAKMDKKIEDTGRKPLKQADE